MSGKHTPGPWYSCPMHRVYSEHPQASVKAVAQCETAANAWLFAAAPALLDALRGMVNNFRSYSECRGDDDVINQALAAIGKAEGQS